MNKIWIRLGIVVLVVTLAALGCDSGTGATGPSVTGVDPASLSATVDTSDLSDVSGGQGLSPTTKTQVLDTIGSGMEILFENLDDFMMANDWEPTPDSYSTIPSNLFELPEPPDSFSLMGSFSGETINFATNTGNIGTLVGSGIVDLSGTLSWNDSLDTAERVTVQSSLDEVVVDVTDAANQLVSNLSVPSAALAMAINANLDVDPTYDGEGFVTSLDATYAMSAIVRLAISVESSNSLDYDGNFILTLELGDSETIAVTEELMEDPAAFSDYLDARIQPNILTLTIQQYSDDKTTPETLYTYSKQDILDYLETEAGA